MCRFYRDLDIAAGSSKNKFPGLGHITSMELKGWGTSFVEATQLIALLNLFLELVAVHSGLQRTPCCHSEQQPAL